ncbi:phosphoadenylyl-sulfate reductase [Elusimicrobiota bacterium]
MDQNELVRQNIDFLIKNTVDVLLWAKDNYHDRLFATTAFGANGVVMLDLMRKKGLDIPVYFIDTNYHFKETLEVKDHYKDKGFNIIQVNPKVTASYDALDEMGPDVCCWINKVEPMKEIMSDKKGYLWLTAVSRDQTGIRGKFKVLQYDENQVIKASPMLFWKEDEIWHYIIDNDLVYNKLYDKGYKSIGCKPCTTPLKKGEGSRSGRWRGTDKEECGLHTKETDNGNSKANSK